MFSGKEINHIKETSIRMKNGTEVAQAVKKHLPEIAVMILWTDKREMSEAPEMMGMAEIAVL